MLHLYDLFPLVHLEEALERRYVRRQAHPELPLSILNYTEQAAYDRAWNPVTLQCRGLIYETSTLRVVARPFPKFFNHGEPNAPELDLDARAVVTDKMDGSLGILYPEPRGYAIATRGSFVSEQARHATSVLVDRCWSWTPDPDCTYLFEIVYPGNRVVLNYGYVDDLFLLDVIETATGASVAYDESTWSRRSEHAWPGRRVESLAYESLAEALAAEPRENAEGLVVYLPERNERVKIKQGDYVALHRILTGTNARDIYEFAAVRSCSDAITRIAEGRDEGKLWASFVGLDPARVEQLVAAGADWLTDAGIPDEFYDWVRGVIDACEEQATKTIQAAIEVARAASEIVEPLGAVPVREQVRPGGDVDSGDAPRERRRPRRDGRRRPARVAAGRTRSDRTVPALRGRRMMWEKFLAIAFGVCAAGIVVGLSCVALGVTMALTGTSDETLWLLAPMIAVGLVIGGLVLSKGWPVA